MKNYVYLSLECSLHTYIHSSLLLVVYLSLCNLMYYSFVLLMCNDGGWNSESVKTDAHTLFSDTGLEPD